MSSDRAASPERGKSRELSREGDDDEISEKYKAFVGGISWHISDRELKDKFREFDATGARVQLDRATGRSRGFGFVMFGDEKGLKAAIAAMHGADLDGRKISVTRAIPQNETQPGTPAAALASGRRGPPGGDRYGARGGYGGSRYGGYGGGYGAPPPAAYGGGYRSDRPYGGGYGGPPPRGGYPPDSYGRGGGYGYDDRGYGGGGYGPGGGYGGYGAPERGADAYAGGYGREGYGREPGYGSGGYGAGSYDRSGYSGGGYGGGGDYGAAPPSDRGAYGGSSSYPERYQPDARASAYPSADRARTSYGARDGSAGPR